jgi:hypothetical protein
MTEEPVYEMTEEPPYAHPSIEEQDWYHTAFRMAEVVTGRLEDEEVIEKLKQAAFDMHPFCEDSVMEEFAEWGLGYLYYLG